MVLDLTVFALNVLLMRELARQFVSIVRRASGGDGGASAFVAVYLLLMLVLPAAGAVLRRWHFHRRRAARGERGEAGAEAWGCLLNPVFFLAVSIVIATMAGVMLAGLLFGKDFGERAEIFLPLMLGVLVFSIVQTVLVYRYLTPPRTPPRGAFWRGPRSEALGDACIFLNMILFQVIWNVMLSAPMPRVGGWEDVAGRVFFLWFLAILVYFPPRIFYLAEDARRPRSWATILLATSPLALHLLGLI
jgi:uncharacterized protein YqgC (DUF456 family)